MRSLGKVLERLHCAWDQIDSAQGTMRFWYQPTRTRQAWERWQHASPHGSIERIEPSGSHAGESPQWAVIADAREPYSEQYYRFWMAKPWRWRVEEYAAVGQNPSPDPGKVLVIDGGMRWIWSTGNAVYTNARTAHAEQISHIGVDRALLVMLDPAPLMGTLRMGVAGSAKAIDRQGDVVICTARDPQPDPGLWPGAEEYRLLVEREHGILLRAEALLAGEVYAGTAFTDLLLDQAPPDERFVFQPPAGVPIHDL